MPSREAPNLPQKLSKILPKPLQTPPNPLLGPLFFYGTESQLEVRSYLIKNDVKKLPKSFQIPPKPLPKASQNPPQTLSKSIQKCDRKKHPFRTRFFHVAP